MKKQEKEKARINLTITADMLAEIETVADEIGINRNSYILQSLRQALDSKKAIAHLENMKGFITEKFEEAFTEAKNTPQITSKSK